jgi:hypothetical protein
MPRSRGKAKGKATANRRFRRATRAAIAAGHDVMPDRREVTFGTWLNTRARWEGAK